MPTKVIARREHLLNVAYQQFSANGYHNTGVDMIVRHSGVSKTTMYKYFRTKEELIVEVLRRRHEEIIKKLDHGLMLSKRQYPNDPPLRHVNIILDMTEQWIQSKSFSGCDFINASAEYADRQDPVHRIAAKHKRTIQKRLEKILTQYPKKSAQDIARTIAMAMDGAIVRAQVMGDKESFALVRSIAASLLKPA